MALRLHNTLSGRKEPFTTLVPNVANVYVCGPTVYDYAHLGHARCYVVYDVLVRHLRETGYEVKFVRNYTDVDDKILKRAAERGESPRELSQRFIDAFAEDMARLHCLTPDVEPRVSEHIPEIIALIEKLVERGHAYVSDGDVYYSVESFPDYGKLSHRSLDQLKAGASERLSDTEQARKKHPADFVLWKGGVHEGATWESPFGPGRPGWHIECSAMSMKHLGETLDLHGGGLDLVFPHHENEVAQSEGATGRCFSNCWVHNGFVEVDKEKMSKSLGNFFTARELFERHEPEALRYFVMTVHYRAPLSLDWTLDDEGKVSGFPSIEEAERRVEYLYRTRLRLESIPEARIKEEEAPLPDELGKLRERLHTALDDDLNMPVALAHVADFLRATNELADRAATKKGTVARSAIEAAREGFELLGRWLGLGTETPSDVLDRIRARRARALGLSGEAIEQKIAERAEARAQRDFARADAIRDELAALGVELHDGPNGTTWTIP
ncbi:MAG: cysteine--tRNA ligase [Myxococcales bacterium]|nr:cysteine--tRNA ligase [Myxococcales bacterium]